MPFSVYSINPEPGGTSQKTLACSLRLPGGDVWSAAGELLTPSSPRSDGSGVTADSVLPPAAGSGKLGSLLSRPRSEGDEQLHALAPRIRLPAPALIDRSE